MLLFDAQLFKNVEMDENMRTDDNRRTRDTSPTEDFERDHLIKRTAAMQKSLKLFFFHQNLIILNF